MAKNKGMESPMSALDALDAPAELTEAGGVGETLESAAPIVVVPVVIEIPTAVMPVAVYLQRHIDVKLTPRQATAARQIFEALNKTDSRLVDGRHVDRLPQAMQWLLDRAADALELPA